MLTVNTAGKSAREAADLTSAALKKFAAQNEQEIQVIVEDTMSAFEIQKILEKFGLSVSIQDDDGRMTLTGSTGTAQAKAQEPEQVLQVKPENLFKPEQQEQLQEIAHDNFNDLNNKAYIKEEEDFENREDIQELNLKVKEAIAKKEAAYKLESGGVFVIMGRTLGRGDDKLGGILIKGFLAGLAKSEPVPDSIILLNDGVKLALFDSSTCDHLKDLEARGTQVLISGVCTSHFGITDSVGAGVIANIYEIVDVINKALKVVCL